VRRLGERFRENVSLQSRIVSSYDQPPGDVTGGHCGQPALRSREHPDDLMA